MDGGNNCRLFCINSRANNGQVIQNLKEGRSQPYQKAERHSNRVYCRLE